MLITAIRDSVFGALVENPSEIPYPGDRPLIPAGEITVALDKIEADRLADLLMLIERQHAMVVSQGLAFVARGDAESIRIMRWNLGVTLQRPIYQTWQEGWALGNDHAIAEIKEGLPRQFSQQFSVAPILRRFAQTEQEKAIANLIKVAPAGLENSGAIREVQQRSLQIAGNFSDDQLSAVKASLISAIAPDADGKVISRAQLEAKLESTLNVSKKRAEAIARTELTNAYNTSRLETMLSSSMVTHVRFLAVSDARTTAICRGRNGMLIPVADRAAIAANKPPLHVKCRSVVSPVMARLNPDHAKWAEDPGRDYQARDLPPLPKGWGVGTLPEVAAISAPIAPVSDALKINQMPRPIRSQVVEALEAIDSVHTDGLLPTIPIKAADLGGNASAQYSYNLLRGRNELTSPIRAKGIEVAIDSPRAGLSLAHEIGHFLDSQVLHEDQKIGFASMFDPDLQEWRSALANSKAYQRLIDMQSRDFVRVWNPRTNELVDRRVDKEYLSYLASPHEAFARSYAQYIAQKSGNNTLLSQLAPLQVDPANSAYPAQWESEDFAEISLALDNLFKKKKWIQ